MKTYFERLRALREDNDMTQEQIARLLGTSQTMYARYERGANELPLRHLKALCELFNVSADLIIGVQLNPAGKCGVVSNPTGAHGKLPGARADAKACTGETE